MCFDFYTKYTDKVHGSKLANQNCILIPLCVAELIYSLTPNKSGRYTGFQYADGEMINEFDACKLKDNKVFHIHVKLLDEKTECFIEKSPNPSAWEISNSEN